MISPYLLTSAYIWIIGESIAIFQSTRSRSGHMEHYMKMTCAIPFTMLLLLHDKGCLANNVKSGQPFLIYSIINSNTAEGCMYKTMVVVVRYSKHTRWTRLIYFNSQPDKQKPRSQGVMHRTETYHLGYRHTWVECQIPYSIANT